MATAAIQHLIELILGMFGKQASKSPLVELRLAIERAEADLAESSSSDSEEEREAKQELLETVRAKVEELETEAEKELCIQVSHALSGELIAQVRLRSADSVAELCRAVLLRTGEDCIASHRLIFQSQVLPHHCSVSDAGIKDGDSVTLARAPLRCLTASHDGSARLWQLRGGPPLDVGSEDSQEDSSPVLLRPGGSLAGAALSPCGNVILTISSEAGGRGRLWCAETGCPLRYLSGGAASASFDPTNGKRLVGVDADGVGIIWCAETGEALLVLIPPKGGSSPSSGEGGGSQEDSEGTYDDEVGLAVFSHCGQVVVTCAGSCAHIWHSASGTALQTLRGHKGSLRAVAFSHTSELVMTASADATARIWSRATGQCLQVLRSHGRPLKLCAFAPDGLRALTGCQDGSVKVWRLSLEGNFRPAASDDEEASPHRTAAECLFTLDGKGGLVNSVCFSPDGCRLLVAAASETAKLYGAELGDLQMEFTAGHVDWVRSASFSPDGLLVATASYDGSARVWSASTGRCLRSLEGHSEAVISVDVLAS